MSFGFGFGLPSWQALSGGFTPASLFSAGEQGAWYDPTDVSISWRRNLLTYTEQFDNAAWTKVNATVTANATVAPDGTTTADKLVSAVGALHERAEQAVTIAASTAYTFTVYAKADGANFAGFRVAQDAAPSVWFDLVNGTVGTVESGWSAAVITAAGNGWYRCKATYTTVGTSYTFRIFLSGSNGDSIFTGDGIKGLFLWGAQLELGSTASLYQQIVTPEITYLQTIQPSPVLFTDSAGTTPVTGVEQFVGLMLDKSKGAPTTLGAELVTNGTFDTNTSGWTAVNSPVLTVGSNGVTIQNNGSTNGILYQALTLVPGRTYRMEVTITYGGGFARVETSAAVPTTVGGSNINVNASGRYQYFFTAVTATTYLVVGNRNDANASNTYDNISVREIPGNHATSAGTKRPKLAARYNLLTYSEQFDNAVWTPVGGSVLSNTTPAPNGTATADTYTATATTARHCVLTTSVVSVSANTNYTLSWSVKKSNYNFITLLFGRTGTEWIAATIDFSSTTPVVSKTGVGATGTLVSSPTITAENNGFWKISFIASLTGATSFAEVALASSATPTYGSFGEESWSASGGESVIIWGADLRPSSQATGLIGPTYQRVAAATDYDTVGFLPYLAFDGIDDSMSTGSIDFTATDKMTVFAGVRKLSDAALGFLAELSNSLSANNGSFWLINGDGQVGAGPTWQFVSKGTNAAFATSPASYASPITNVLTGVGNILGDVTTLRVNGTQVASSTADQGTSNYGNYPLFIGQRNNTSLPFNGWMSSLIIRGAQSTDSQISATESWVNQRTGAY
jgi:hypothetical protein